ncbi:MAG: oxidative damage protection protein [Thermoanaerobaculaceae bacterium]|nr:oxidative damage protection protein [Thermoanaerobaculaceae bacterium]TAM46676.1 MAG: oxidative damage protection protein [Acidobacteriota bacterium]
MPITCSRCGSAADEMAQPPMPTALGIQIQRSVCPSCWQEWLRTQVMLINEYRLNLVDPEARKALEGQLRAFLNVPADRPE